MSDTTKPMVVWALPERVKFLVADTTAPIYSRPAKWDGRRPHLLLPIEGRALRVGAYLFRQRSDGNTEWCHIRDPEGEWSADGPDMLWDLLMDAVEGVEP